MSHLKQMGMGMLLYAQDYDERLPRKELWCDGLMTYVKNPRAFQCPDLPEERGADAYNAQLSMAAVNLVDSPYSTVAAFDARVRRGLHIERILGVDQCRDATGARHAGQAGQERARAPRRPPSHDLGDLAWNDHPCQISYHVLSCRQDSRYSGRAGVEPQYLEAWSAKVVDPPGLAGAALDASRRHHGHPYRDADRLTNPATDQIGEPTQGFFTRDHDGALEMGRLDRVLDRVAPARSATGTG